MYRMKVLNRILFIATAAYLLTWLSGCAEGEAPTTPVNISGMISVPDGVQSNSSKVTVNLYHAWALEGVLRHPVEFIESFETTAGEYNFSFDYPVETGEGLLVYAWIDLDGDDVHCTPEIRTDRAGRRAGLPVCRSHGQYHARCAVCRSRMVLSTGHGLKLSGVSPGYTSVLVRT